VNHRPKEMLLISFSSQQVLVRQHRTKFHFVKICWFPFFFAGRNLDSTCDTTCRVLVGAIASFALIALPTALYLYWRKRYLSKM
jgi:hypothetical protein